VLDDGVYDAFIVWAQARDDAIDDARDTTADVRRRVRVEFQLAITAGAHKGEVVEIVASRMPAGMHAHDPIDLAGLPCTLVVENGEPRIEP
jgi:hypothetical protein